ncbi:MAG: hypothetical protein IKH56_05475, partial [Oscillospiraceae bacterium]|nr:hypothetical protein [Oscillospiraceae bacterium]
LVFVLWLANPLHSNTGGFLFRIGLAFLNHRHSLWFSVFKKKSTLILLKSEYFYGGEGGI